MIRDAGLALVMRIVGTTLWLGYMILLARVLSKEDFGMVFFAINLILIATPIATLGFDTTMLRFGSQYWISGQKNQYSLLLRQARTLAFAGGVICAAVLLVIYRMKITTPISESIIITCVVGGCIVASSIMSIHRDALRSAGKLVLALMGFTVIRTILPLLGSVILAFTGHLSAVAALGLLCASLGSSLVFEFFQISKLKSREHENEPVHHFVVQPHLKVAFAVWPGDVAGAVLMRIAGLLISLKLGLEAAALYFAAERVANLGQFLSAKMIPKWL